MTRFIIFSMLCLALLSGCATQEKYVKILDGWVGSNERDLILTWGAPDSAYELSDSEKLLVYKKSSSEVIGGTPPVHTTNIVNGVAYTRTYGGTSPYIVNYNCKTTFTLVDKIVKEWKIEGNGCVAE